MRKGRSQRKSRGSLPPLSMRPHASAPGDAGGGPQVVIGLAGPRSEEAPVLETRGPETAPSPARASQPSMRPAAPKLEVLPVREPVLPASVPAHAVAEAAQVDSLAGVERDVAAASAPSEGHDADAYHEPSAPQEGALRAPDERSIPPMGDLAVEPVAEQFFSQGDLSAMAGDDDEDERWERLPGKTERKSQPHVVERRQRLSRYVRWAVAGASVLCLAALARTALSPSVRSLAAQAPASVAVAALEAPSTKAAAIAPSPGPVASPAAEAPAAEAPAPIAEAPAAEAPAAEAAKEVAADARTALQEKNDTRRLLERGKLAEAIAAGERSVALDPQDGEAWLLLGAAYQEKGNAAEARRCYTACAKEGKRGPLGECRAMLH